MSEKVQTDINHSINNKNPFSNHVSIILSNQWCTVCFIHFWLVGGTLLTQYVIYAGKSLVHEFTFLANFP